MANRTSLSKQPLKLSFPSCLSYFDSVNFLVPTLLHRSDHTAPHMAAPLLFSVLLSPTLYCAVSFHKQVMQSHACVLYLSLCLFICGFYSPSSLTHVHMYLCIYDCLYHLCELYGIYQSLLSINAPSAAPMHSIHLYFKTFPHFPTSIWISITLKYLGPSSLHSSRRSMVSSKDDSDHSTAFISDSTHISKCYIWKPFSSCSAV